MSKTLRGVGKAIRKQFASFRKQKNKKQKTFDKVCVRDECKCNKEDKRQ